MMTDALHPSLELLRQEYVLVQAWKKTASHIRYHNWYSDTLALDRATVNLPRFLGELAEQLQAPDQWVSDPLRIVPAPKSQQWRVTKETKVWEPVDRSNSSSKLRPLAHVSLKDQVVATAVMMCLADRTESIQNDPRSSITDADARRQVISYGNRLFCDVANSQLRHRWGSGKLYRAYYEDYRSFLARPQMAAEAASAHIVAVDGKARILVIHSDLRQFYDRVRPDLLAQKVNALTRHGDDPLFFSLAHRLLNWAWDPKDATEVAEYKKRAELPDFSSIALPQGLVAAGFFSNIVLLDFDQCLRESLLQEIEPGLRIEDACRYVDDLRIVMKDEGERDLAEIKRLALGWIQTLLDKCAHGLVASEEKTLVAKFKGDERPLVRQSRKMARIQNAISGGFDAIGGEEILDAVQGLIRSQQRYSKEGIQDRGWALSPVPDVGDATVARFAAARFRSTFRSLRPLLMDTLSDGGSADTEASEGAGGRSCAPRTQAELDEDARAFALELIENWVEDPSNVRLLRIGLDLWPAADVIENVLGLLRPFTKKGGRRGAPRRVAWYCLSEIFRAGATETGFVEDGESLPAEINLTAFRQLLWEEAVRLVSLPSSTLPWYLKQQILLFLAANNRAKTPVLRRGTNPEIAHYRELIRFLDGEEAGLTSESFATLAILARRSFSDKDSAIQLVRAEMTPRRLQQIAERDPSYGIEILASRKDLSETISPRLRDDLCLSRIVEDGGRLSLSQAVLLADPNHNGPLRNEIGVLRFAIKFLTKWPAIPEAGAITPADVLLELRNPIEGLSESDSIKIVPSRVASLGSMYSPPSWCPTEDWWRFHLGYLLRFILSARQDFTKTVRTPHWKEGTATYRTPESHWYQRLYGFYNGRSAFGDDWLPISDWVERLLSALLQWPGCRDSEMAKWVRGGIDETLTNIGLRLKEIIAKQGASGSVLMLPLDAPWPDKRQFRACVVQTVIPVARDFKADLTLSDPVTRRRHRNHLSSALAAVGRMLDLRDTHCPNGAGGGRLDWLILPELSVHPDDVKTHLVPFARANKTIIVAGLAYEKIFADQPLINSALWVIPVKSASHGLQVMTVRQGKQHLAQIEKNHNAAGDVIQGFRPCQWLVGYEWSGAEQKSPLWLTASVCYDATDLQLATDLRRNSDVFAILAYNKDVNTFDQMALALHYHMFQMVIVANNGCYGGSNAYSPYEKSYERQVFHLHGQPQASMAFVDIPDIASFITRYEDASSPADAAKIAPNSGQSWKYPPANMTNSL